MECDLGVRQFVRQNIKDNPWYKYHEDDKFIEIKSSPKERINNNNYIGVAKSLAKHLNDFINKTENIGDIFYRTFDYKGKIGVVIAPTDHQLRLLNAKEDSERAEILAEEDERQNSIDIEHNIIEDKIRSGEIKQICEI